MLLIFLKARLENMQQKSGMQCAFHDCKSELIQVTCEHCCCSYCLRYYNSTLSLFCIQKRDFYGSLICTLKIKLLLECETIDCLEMVYLLYAFVSLHFTLDVNYAVFIILYSCIFLPKFCKSQNPFSSKKEQKCYKNGHFSSHCTDSFMLLP